jgi:cytoskeletal protein RodZ
LGEVTNNTLLVLVVVVSVWHGLALWPNYQQFHRMTLSPRKQKTQKHETTKHKTPPNNSIKKGENATRYFEKGLNA